MQVSIDSLKALQPQHPFFIGIDSDGCVFDSMEIKHKECFCPAFINHFGLQPISKYARETWEFVNLYSKNRGLNRFPGVIKTLDLLAERKEVKERKATLPKLQGLRSWIEKTPKLSNSALEAEIQETQDKDLQQTLEWSLDVNKAVKSIVRDVPPFPSVEITLKAIKEKADMIVVSQTPNETLNREWQEHGLHRYPLLIAGQELGTKTEHLKTAAQGKYETSHILVIGDAPGDLKAAQSNGAFFYPILAGQEEESWQTFFSEGLNRFFEGSYGDGYQQQLIDMFNASLPEQPPWATSS